MKVRTGWAALLLMATIVLSACGGSGGGSDGGGTGTGTLSLSLTDAKPALPDNVTNCIVTIDEVLVHSSGGEWKSLPMVQTPYTIDLLQFSDGTSTEFVPPVALESGKYTQIRLSVTHAVLRFDDGNTTQDVTMTIPSGNLKTDKNFDFDVTESAAVDITVDFDLSKSIVVQGPAGSESYHLKPVLHIVETSEAATIEGSIGNSHFTLENNNYVLITVIAKSNNEEYTKVRVDKDTTAGATQTTYSIFWIVPNQDYRVEIDYNPLTGIPPASDASKDVLAADVEPGETAIVDFP
jgi:hypothetical protein